MSDVTPFFHQLSKRYPTPDKVQKLLRSLKYNREEDGETVYSARETFRQKKAHCLEACLLSAAILEHRGYPPIILNLDSIDNLNHAVFIFKEKTGWGAIGRSREPGLHGRAPRFRSIRDLALSYCEPYIDDTGKITGFALAHLDESGVDWRGSSRNVRKVEKLVTTLRFKKIKFSERRYRALVIRYREKGPLLNGRHWW